VLGHQIEKLGALVLGRREEGSVVIRDEEVNAAIARSHLNVQIS
jgi:hypothetical protein